MFLPASVEGTRGPLAAPRQRPTPAPSVPPPARLPPAPPVAPARAPAPDPVRPQPQPPRPPEHSPSPTVPAPGPARRARYLLNQLVIEPTRHRCDEIIDYVKFLQLQVKVLSMSRLGGAAAVGPLVASMASKQCYSLPSLAVDGHMNDVHISSDR
eukprot:XP_020401115.1 transcription factor UNE12-like [Zea mays]